MAETNNKKIIDKDYLTKQLYIYHKEYTRKLNNEKQNNLAIDSKHITFENGYVLGLNIINEKDTAKNNDYLSLMDKENGVMEWKTPKNIVDYGNDRESDNLVTARALANFTGSDTINIVGEITEGSWKVGNISITNNDLNLGNINFNIDTDEKKLKLSLIDSEEEWGIENHINFSTDKLSASELTVGNNVKISEGKIETNEVIFGKVSLSKAEEGNLKVTRKDDAFVNFEDVPVLLKEINTSKENGKGYLLINGTKYKVTTNSDAYYATIQKMVKEEADIKDEQSNNDSEEETQS